MMVALPTSSKRSGALRFRDGRVLADETVCTIFLGAAFFVAALVFGGSCAFTFASLAGFLEGCECACASSSSSTEHARLRAVPELMVIVEIDGKSGVDCGAAALRSPSGWADGSFAGHEDECCSGEAGRTGDCEAFGVFGTEERGEEAREQDCDIFVFFV